MNKDFTIWMPGSEYFYLHFVKAMAPVLKLNSHTEALVLAHILNDYPDGRVFLTAAARKELMNKAGISKQTLTNCINTYKDLKILIGEDGSYTLPDFLLFPDVVNMMSNRGLDVVLKFRNSKKRKTGA